MADTTRYITVLFIQQGDSWLAQALEYDLAAQGANVEAAKRAFERTFFGYLELDRRMNRQPLSTLRPAPHKFWNMFRTILSRRGVELKAEPIESEVPSETPPAFMVSAFPGTACRSLFRGCALWCRGLGLLDDAGKEIAQPEKLIQGHADGDVAFSSHG